MNPLFSENDVLLASRRRLLLARSESFLCTLVNTRAAHVPLADLNSKELAAKAVELASALEDAVDMWEESAKNRYVAAKVTGEVE